MLELFKVSYLLGKEEDGFETRMPCNPGSLCKPDGCKPYQQGCIPYDD